MSMVNLLPDDYTRRRNQRRANLVCAALFAIVTVSVLGAAVASRHRLSNTRTVVRQINADYVEAAKKLDQMQQLQAKKKQLTRKAQLTASLLERIPRSTVLAVITNARPPGTSLSKFKLTTKRIVIATPKGKAKSAKFAAKRKKKQEPKQVLLVVEIEITGWAPTDIEVAQFINTLDRSPLTKSVELVHSRQDKLDEAIVRGFKVRLELNTNADAIEIAKLAAPGTIAPCLPDGNLPSVLKALLGAGS